MDEEREQQILREFRKLWSELSVAQLELMMGLFVLAGLWLDETRGCLATWCSSVS